MFRKPTRKIAQRKRTEEEPSSPSEKGSSDDEPATSSSVTVPTKRASRKRNLLIQTTSQSKRKAMDDVESSTDSEESDEKPVELDVKFSSSGAQRTGPADMGATARSEVDTEYGKDAQSQFERVQAILKETGEGPSSDKIYRGMAVYGAKIKEDTTKGNAASGLNRKGPIRATQFMRASVRWDYAPDICKDYKETGFCTFGDSCKFLHDRSDYKHGWEIDRDFEEGKNKEAKDDEFLVSSEDDEDDELPLLASSARSRSKTCKHYFCEKCALEHYRKSKKCFVCNVKTEGVFNAARELMAKLKAQAEKEDDEEAGGSDDEGGVVEDTKVELLEDEEGGGEARGQERATRKR
ncbi:zinc finger protein [Aphelenchoides avenae]|nr:zinc finger protein [Aphelenchus avenae]